MTDFIESFDKTKEEETKQMRQTEDSIIELLSHISGQMGRETKLPSFKEAENMAGDLKFKQGQLENAVVTLARLNKEKEMRNQDFEKIMLLDQKVISELDQLKEKIGTMKDDLSNKFNTNEQLKSDWDDTARRLKNKRQFMIRKKEVLNNQVRTLNMQ